MGRSFFRSNELKVPRSGHGLFSVPNMTPEQLKLPTARVAGSLMQLHRPALEREEEREEEGGGERDALPKSEAYVSVEIPSTSLGPPLHVHMQQLVVATYNMALIPLGHRLKASVERHEIRKIRKKKKKINR